MTDPTDPPSATARTPGGERVKPSIRKRIEAARASAQARAERAPRPVLRVATAFLRDLARIEPFDRAMTLAAQAFVSIFPLLIAWAAFIDDPDISLSDQISNTLKVSDATRAVLNETLPSTTQPSTTFGVISVLIVLISATSLSRALGRMYSKAWHVAPSGWGTGWRWIVVILAICAAAVTTRYVNASAEGSPEKVGALAVTFLINTAALAWIPWLLLMRRVSIIRLLPGAALTGIASVALYLAGHFYLPHALNISTEHFGALGVAFALIGWLFVLSFALIVAAVLGAVFVRDEGVEALGRTVRRRSTALFHRA